MSIDFTFDGDHHLYLVQGRPVPSVTQVLQATGLGADYSMVPPQVLERKRTIGQFVHQATQYLDEGSLGNGRRSRLKKVLLSGGLVCYSECVRKCTQILGGSCVWEP